MAQSQDTSRRYLFYSQDSLQFGRWGDRKNQEKYNPLLPKASPNQYLLSNPHFAGRNRNFGIFFSNAKILIL